MIDNEKQELEPFLEKAVRFQEHCEQVRVFRFHIFVLVLPVAAHSKLVTTVKPNPIFTFPACGFLSQVRGRCLVHCIAGVSRSSSCVLAYLVKVKREWLYEVRRSTNTTDTNP